MNLQNNRLMNRAKKYNEVYDDHGQTMSRDSREDVCALMTEYIENFEPVLSEPGTCLFEEKEMPLNPRKR